MNYNKITKKLFDKYNIRGLEQERANLSPKHLANRSESENGRVDCFFQKTSMKTIVIVIGLLSLIFLNSSCEYKKYKRNPHIDKNGSTLSKAEMDELGFQKVFNEVFDPYCSSCHRDEKPTINKKIPLNNYAEIFAKIPDIKTSVLVKGTMPKKKILPARARSILAAWIELGAPEFGKIQTPALPPLEPTFSSIRNRIFNVRCSDCHNPQSKECKSLANNGSPSGLDAKVFAENSEGNSEKDEKGFNGESCHLELADYEELLHGEQEKVKEMVLPGNPDDSLLVLTLERRDGKEMPPPEQGYSPLSDEEVRVIREWISAGAQNN